jgi:hypothetical protein
MSLNRVGWRLKVVAARADVAGWRRLERKGASVVTHRRGNRFGAFVLGVVVSVGGSAALANRYRESPGYEWGREHCGPATGNRTSYASCVSCCMRGAQHEEYPAEEAGGCGHFCKRVPWRIWMSA